MYILYKALPILLLSVCQLAFSQADHKLCEQKIKCFECIQTVGCNWCTRPAASLNSQAPRCLPKNSSLENCEFDNEYNKKTKTGQHSGEVAEDNNFQLRKGEKVNVTFKYVDQTDRPLDLYILMDLSNTMKHHREKVANLASELIKLLKSLTTDIKLGFGSFVDKPIPPYTQTGSSSTYSFKNHLPLTSDSEKFKTTVLNAITSSNLDAPEGGLDALMQVVVCAPDIGWRTNSSLKSRGIVVLSTDQTFHLAGDGKLGGIIEPNDGECHLKNDEYTEATIKDYPSIAQIKNKLARHDIYTIFAVTQGTMKVYKELASQLSPLSVAELITDEKSNGSTTIADVIIEQYRKLVRTVNIEARIPSDFHVTANYYAQCEKNGKYTKGSSCTNIAPASTIMFKVELELKECPDNEITKRFIQIFPTQGSHKIKHVEIEALCGCKCEVQDARSNNVSESRKICNSNGFLQCGICKCDETWGGPDCTCSNINHNITAYLAYCMNNGQLCSGNGKCVCGECKCYQENKFSGKFCQYDISACPPVQNSDKGLCNEDVRQGKCSEGKCNCATGFRGLRCECPTEEKLHSTPPHKNCHSPGSSKICNGKGYCLCEDDGTVMCKCNKGHGGSHCEFRFAKDVGCEKATETNLPCVQCIIVKNGGQDDEDAKKMCAAECKLKKLKFMDSLINILDVQQYCKGTETGTCENYYIGNTDIRSQEVTIYIVTRGNRGSCPPINLIAILSSVIGAVVIGVITLLIWKLLTHFHDKREYERFEKERRAADWTMENNPLYRTAATEFQNPAYKDQ